MGPPALPAAPPAALPTLDNPPPTAPPAGQSTVTLDQSFFFNSLEPRQGVSYAAPADPSAPLPSPWVLPHHLHHGALHHGQHPLHTPAHGAPAWHPHHPRLFSAPENGHGHHPHSVGHYVGHPHRVAAVSATPHASPFVVADPSTVGGSGVLARPRGFWMIHEPPAAQHTDLALRDGGFLPQRASGGSLGHAALQRAALELSAPCAPPPAAGRLIASFVSDDGVYHCVFPVKETALGRLIGKGGGTLRRVEALSGAVIQVDHDRMLCLPCPAVAEPSVHADDVACETDETEKTAEGRSSSPERSLRRARTPVLSRGMGQGGSARGQQEGLVAVVSYGPTLDVAMRGMEFAVEMATERPGGGSSRGGRGSGPRDGRRSERGKVGSEAGQGEPNRALCSNAGQSSSPHVRDNPLAIPRARSAQEASSPAVPRSADGGQRRSTLEVVAAPAPAGATSPSLPSPDGAGVDPPTCIRRVILSAKDARWFVLGGGALLQSLCKSTGSRCTLHTLARGDTPPAGPDGAAAVSADGCATPTPGRDSDAEPPCLLMIEGTMAAVDAAVAWVARASPSCELALAPVWDPRGPPSPALAAWPPLATESKPAPPTEATYRQSTMGAGKPPRSPSPRRKTVSAGASPHGTPLRAAAPAWSRKGRAGREDECGEPAAAPAVAPS